MKTMPIRRLAVLSATTVLASAVALGTAAQAQATNYGGYSMDQLYQMCTSHGSREWPMGQGGEDLVPTTQLQEGSSGDCVAYAQKQLTWSGYPNLAVDGSFGPLTLAAVRGFQTRMSVNPACGPVDGVVGPRTWMCLQTQN